MFFSLFLSKNQKQVHRWKEEHKEIVALATSLLHNYEIGEHNKAKKILEELRITTFNHLMSEDAEFFRLLKDQENQDSEMKHFIREFDETFYGTKTALMHFLDKYVKKEVQLDNQFLEKFNELVDILLKRIEFEEKNLYSKLETK